MTNRVEQWGGIEAGTHLRLIDGELDENERQHAAMRQMSRDIETRLTDKMDAGFREVKSEMRTGFAKNEEAGDSSRRLIIGLLSGVVVACVLLVINVILVTAGGGP